MTKNQTFTSNFAENELHLAIPKVSFGKMVHDFLSEKRDTEIMIDISSGHTLTITQLLQKSTHLAQALRLHGYASNAVLAILSDNSLHFFIPLLASLYNLTVTSLVNPAYTRLELKSCLDITKPKIIFCSTKCLSKLLDLKKHLDYIKEIIIIDSDIKSDGAITLQSFINCSFEMNTNFETLEMDPLTTPALILYSSGTTGPSKGVTLSHYNFVVAHSVEFKFKSSGKKSTIVFSPLCHAMGLNRAFNAIFSDTKIVLMKRFNEEMFLRTIQNFKVQYITVPPPLMVFFAKSPKVDNYNLSALELIICAAAPLRNDLQETVARRLKLTVTQGYGMTEMTSLVLFLSPDIYKPGACGYTVPLTKCEVRDVGSEKSLDPYEHGELCFQTPQFMLGYFNNEYATKTMINESGWIRTGDIGYYDSDKCFYVVDRIKELIKYNGYQVAPVELETILLGHPLVQDAAVIGVPHDRHGEVPLAFVVPKSGARVSEKELINYVAGLVNSQKQLRGGIKFISTIPKTTTGKILRRNLRFLLKDNVIRPKL